VKCSNKVERKRTIERRGTGEKEHIEKWRTKYREKERRKKHKRERWKRKDENLAVHDIFISLSFWVQHFESLVKCYVHFRRSILVVGDHITKQFANTADAILLEGQYNIQIGSWTSCKGILIVKKQVDKACYICPYEHSNEPSGSVRRGKFLV
jgi:hypothetical protein